MHSKVIALGGQLKTEEARLRRIDISWVYRGYEYAYIFRIAVCKSKALPRVKEYMRWAAELFQNISPFSEERTKRYEKLIEHPEIDTCYLAINKMMLASR